MLKFPDNFSIIDKINYLQKKILVCSVAYYKCNTSFRSDYDYDNMCKELVKLQNSFGNNIIKDIRFGYVYYDFEGSTGFYLYSRLDKQDKDYILKFTSLILSDSIYSVCDPKNIKKSKNKLF